MIVRVALRIAGGLLGLAAAFIALLAPIAAYVNVAAESEWRKQHPPDFWGGVAYVLITLFIMALFTGAAYALFRYTFGTPADSTGKTVHPTASE